MFIKYTGVILLLFHFSQDGIYPFCPNLSILRKASTYRNIIIAGMREEYVVGEETDMKIVI